MSDGDNIRPATPSDQTPVIHEAVPSVPARQLSLSRAQFRMLAVVATAVLVIGLGYFLWYKPHQPNAVLARSLRQTMELQSAHVKLNLKTGQPGTAATATLTAEGGVSIGATGSYTLSGTYSANQSKLGFELRSTDGKDIYVKANGLAGLSGLLGADAGQYGITEAGNPFQALENTWLVIPKDTRDMLLKDTGAAGAGSAGTRLSEADQNKLADLYKRHPFIAVSKALADETVEGTPSRHYQAVVDRTELAAFIGAVQKEVTSLKLTDQQVKSIREITLPSQPIDVWIAKDSGYITQVRYVSGSGKDAVALQVNLSQVNQPVKVEQPQGAKPLFEALSGALLGGVQPQ